MSSNYIELPVEGGGAGAGVSSLNGLTGTLSLLPGSGISITPSGGSITITNTGSGGSAITALTGDGTASGPGSAALTLATVNSNLGSFGSATTVPALTVNAKGLITAVTSTTIQLSESQVTNLVSDLAGKQATGNYITALTGDVSAAGPGSAAATVNSVGGVSAATIAASNNFVILSKAANYAILASDFNNLPNTIIYANSSGGAFNLTFPSPATVNAGAVVYVFDSAGSFGTNPVTMVRAGSETIQGVAASLALSANWGTYAFTTDGTNWFKVGTASNVATRSFTSSGTWVIPAGVTRARISARGGAGGGGGGASGGGGSTATAGGGGGAGGTGPCAPSVTQDYPLTPGATATVTIGAGGAGGAGGVAQAANAAGVVGLNGGAGGTGGTTTFVFGGTTYNWGGCIGSSLGSAGATFNAAGLGGGAGRQNIYGGGMTGSGNGGAPNVAGAAPQSVVSRGSPYVLSVAATSGGAAGGANGGGGGGTSTPSQGYDYLVSGAQTPSATGGAGGAAGLPGSAGAAGGTVLAGEGGIGGGGGGGGGVLATTGSQGGSGGAASAGSNGALVVTWNE